MLEAVPSSVSGAASTKSEKALPKILPPTLPGAVCVQWRKCGKASCRCATGKKHGPYYCRFWRQDGKLRKAYVKPADVDATRAACAARQQQAQALRRLVRSSASLWRQLQAGLRQLGL